MGTLLKLKRPDGKRIRPLGYRPPNLNSYETRIVTAWSQYQRGVTGFKPIIEAITRWVNSKQADEAQRYRLLGMSLDYVATVDEETSPIFIAVHLRALARSLGIS